MKTLSLGIPAYTALRAERYTLKAWRGSVLPVRNSGAMAVVEGLGDHGCEYMTGGCVVVLGETGRNFAAGMSGGLAYVYDENKNFMKMLNCEMVSVENLDEEDTKRCLDLIALHHIYTSSKKAALILESWPAKQKQFKKIIPLDYKRVLEQSKKEDQKKKLSIK